MTEMYIGKHLTRVRNEMIHKFFGDLGEIVLSYLPPTLILDNIGKLKRKDWEKMERYTEDDYSVSLDERIELLVDA